MTPPVRVLLLEIPLLLRGVFEHAIERQAGCELLRDSREALVMLAHQGDAPDVVILGLTAAEDATLVPALFARWPAARIMTVTQSGEDAAVYELTPQREPVDQLAPATIIDKLRDAVHERRASEKEGRP